jgi:hypothetical protein
MIVEIAAIKCGYQALIFSPRNAVSHNLTLFNLQLPYSILRHGDGTPGKGPR